MLQDKYIYTKCLKLSVLLGSGFGIRIWDFVYEVIMYPVGGSV